jgi:hypothetical protein
MFLEIAHRFPPGIVFSASSVFLDDALLFVLFIIWSSNEIKHILVQLVDVSDELLKLLSSANEECSEASKVSNACILWWKRQRKLPC